MEILVNPVSIEPRTCDECPENYPACTTEVDVCVGNDVDVCVHADGGGCIIHIE